MSSPVVDALAAPSRPYGHAPLRRPGSVRRTSSIDTRWPEGEGGPAHMLCAARDLLTPRHGEPRVLQAVSLTVVVAPDRVIEAIDCPEVPALQRLVGARPGGKLRQALEEALPGARERGDPIHLLVDDLSGATLVAGWAFSRWRTENTPPRRPRAEMEDICTGFRKGSTALDLRQLGHRSQNTARVPPLVDPQDPLGWHAMPDYREVAMRRARRVDVWLQDGLQIEAMFQDSATAPDGGDRIAVHEYAVHATADPITGVVVSVTADPRVLPYRECPGAAANMHRMVGSPLHEWRTKVLSELARAAGCTHLNDALRSMAEAPQLAAALTEA